MSDDGRLLLETAARFERVLPGPIERVWEHLTSREHMPVWFGGHGMVYTIEPRLGGKVSLANDHIRGVVTQWKPPRLLAYTWNVFMPGLAESPFPESYVTFELSSKGSDVVLTLTHRPIAPGFAPFTLMGWHTFLELLRAMLRHEPLESKDVLMERNRARYNAPSTRPDQS
jgi:uncharacterized protein YndB with AHSA1/START domain